MASKFNEFFVSVASKIANNIHPYDNDNDICIAPPVASIFSFSNDPVSLSEVSDAIKSLEP